MCAMRGLWKARKLIRSHITNIDNHLPTTDDGAWTSGLACGRKWHIGLPTPYVNVFKHYVPFSSHFGINIVLTTYYRTINQININMTKILNLIHNNKLYKECTSFVPSKCLTFLNQIVFVSSWLRYLRVFSPQWCPNTNNLRITLNPYIYKKIIIIVIIIAHL